VTIFNMGSINIDHIYRVDHLPRAGETISACNLSTGLGGKGANLSLVIARLGGRVRHIGAVGEDGTWARDALGTAGVDTTHVVMVSDATGHAIIYVDDAAENMIVIHGGANRALSMGQIEVALADAVPGDWFLAQNETNLVAEAIRVARAAGLKIAYAAAPFDATVAAGMMGQVDLLAVNAGEAAALGACLGCPVEDLPVPAALITLGTAGAVYRLRDRTGRRMETRIGSVSVDAVDTTGAGDTFLGAFLGALDGGGDTEAALVEASSAAALQVTRPGAAEAIPTTSELARFMVDRAAPVPVTAMRDA